MWFWFRSDGLSLWKCIIESKKIFFKKTDEIAVLPSPHDSKMIRKRKIHLHTVTYAPFDLF